MTGGQRVLSTFDVETLDVETAGKWFGKILVFTERLAVGVLRTFDLLVVRGNKGKAFLTGYGIDQNVVIITGSVKAAPSRSLHRDIDIVYVGRLSPIKQVEQFIEVVRRVCIARPSTRAAIVGDGESMVGLKAYAERLGLSGNIQFLGKRADVEAILARSKMFLLTSKSEGLSIAMLEAMAAGVVPLVADVGELGDVVCDGVNGYLVQPNRIDLYSAKVVSLLEDKALWCTLSSHAIETAMECSSLEVVANKWNESIRLTVERASGCAAIGEASDGILKRRWRFCDQ
jgi:glycosyltransferase involved in cell wall biosynthesis